jgi:hypothetical protein
VGQNVAVAWAAWHTLASFVDSPEGRNLAVAFPLAFQVESLERALSWSCEEIKKKRTSREWEFKPAVNKSKAGSKKG